MSDLIRREDVNDLIKQICDACGEGEKYNGVMCRCCRFDDFIGVVDNIPSADPERKKGNWIVKEEDWRKQLEWDECSECGFATTKQYNFCPNCGADMRMSDE